MLKSSISPALEVARQFTAGGKGTETSRLREMKGSTHRDGQSAIYPHRMILLQSGDRVLHFVGKDPIGRAAIVTVAMQRDLQCAHICRVRGDNFSRSRIIKKPTDFAAFVIRLVQLRALVQKPPGISLRQWIARRSVPRGDAAGECETSRQPSQ